MRIIVGVSGASGARLAIRFIKILEELGVEVYSIITKSAILVAKVEEGEEAIEEIQRHSRKLFMEDEMDAPMSSGSFTTNGMVIIPCSMNTIAKLSYGITDNLLLRAADVQIKMGNKLVIVPRESPLSRIHLRNLYRISRLNNVYIIFPLLTYYHKPSTIDEMENYTLGRILDILNIKHNLYRRWRSGL